MQIVIDIPDEWKTRIEYNRRPNSIECGQLVESIWKGKILPKGHGRLIDADKTLTDAWQNFYRHEDEWEEKDEDYVPLHRFYDQNGFECCQQTIVNAPTIIEADKEDQNESNN